ncbi:hypothetical protein [Myroides sp. C4067]|uniref:hypothetical protein n=1 Tax=Myroides sp. C4067 TaxID=3136765 RepID=UPI0031010882
MGIFDIFKRKPPAVEPTDTCDYTQICSHKEAERHFNKGHLDKLHLIGLVFGGDDSPFNILYVSPEAALQKREIDNYIVDLLQQGYKVQYKAFPEYKGNSFVPSKVIIEVDGDQVFTKEIEIW